MGLSTLVLYDLITEGGRNPEMLHLCKARCDIWKYPTYVVAKILSFYCSVKWLCLLTVK